MTWITSFKKKRSHNTLLAEGSQPTHPNESVDSKTDVDQTADQIITRDPDTTIPTAGMDLDATMRISRSDRDATIRKSLYLPSRIYLRAAELARSNEKMAHENVALLRPNEQPTQSLQPGLITLPQKKDVKTRLLSVTSVVCLLLILFLVAYETFSRVRDPRLLALPNQSKAQVDQLIAHARTIGVPASFLNPILQKEHTIDQSLPWFSPSFYASPSSVYRTQANQYTLLRGQVQQVITTATQQLQDQAQKDLQQFQDVLSRRNMQPIGNSQAFTQNFSDDQFLMGSAHNPQDYITISQDARASTNALNSMEAMSNTLTNINTMLATMKQAHLNITVLQQSYQQDMDTFNSTTDSGALQHLHSQLQTHYPIVSCGARCKATRFHEPDQYIKDVWKGYNSLSETSAK